MFRPDFVEHKIKLFTIWPIVPTIIVFIMFVSFDVQ